MRHARHTISCFILPWHCAALCLSLLTASPLPAHERIAVAQRRSDRGLAVEELGRSFGSEELREPLAIAVDQRHFVYVADAMAGKVFRFDENGGSLEFEPPSSASDIYPIDIAVEGPTVYVLEYTRNRVLRYDLAWEDRIGFREVTDFNPACLCTSDARAEKRHEKNVLSYHEE